MRKYRSAFIAAYILIILAGVIWHAGGVSAENTIKLKVNSHTTSTATMANMKPGDQMRSEYTIINEGDDKFDYDVDFKFKSGDADLYEILQMTLKKEGVILYSGVMSAAAGRVTVGTLAGGGQEVITMDVTFPWEAGNEYQGKQTTVAFEFSASAAPEPSPEPTIAPNPTPSATAEPTPTASPEPTIAPSPTPSATATTEPSAGPSAEPTATASPEPSAAPSPTPTPPATAEPTSGPPTVPTATASPGVPGVIVTPGPSAAPSSGPSATPGPDDITVTEAPVPLGDGGQNDGSAPTASPGAGVTTGSTATPAPSPSPGHEIKLADDELPLGAPDAGDPLPDTAEPWYNLILVSLAAAVLCIIILRRLRSRR